METRALLTGGTGFVGAALARRLLADGHHVHLLLRAEHDPWRLQGLGGRLTAHTVDLLDRPALLERVAAIRPAWVFHLAAFGAYSWQDDLQEMLRTNLLSTVNLVEASLKIGCDAFVHTGSSSEYGFKDHPPTEQERLDPASHYAVTKAAATLFCRHEAQRLGAPLRVLRLYSIYGPWESPRRLIPTLIVRGLDGELPPLVEAGVARDLVYVDDAVEAYLRAATTAGQEPGAVYNVGSGRQTTVGEIVEAARRILEIEATPAFTTMPNRSWDTGCWVGQVDLAASKLGWTAATGFEEGFRRTVEWLRSCPDLLALYRARCPRPDPRGCHAPGPDGARPRSPARQR